MSCILPAYFTALSNILFFIPSLPAPHPSTRACTHAHTHTRKMGSQRPRRKIILSLEGGAATRLQMTKAALFMKWIFFKTWQEAERYFSLYPAVVLYACAHACSHMCVRERERLKDKCIQGSTSFQTGEQAAMKQR